MLVHLNTHILTYLHTCIFAYWHTCVRTLTAHANIKLKLTQKYGAKVNIARPDSLLCHLFLVPAVLSDSCSCNCSFVQHVVGLQHSLVRQTAANQVVTNTAQHRDAENYIHQD